MIEATQSDPTSGPEYWRKQHHRMADVLRDHVVDVLQCEAEPHVIADAVEAVREAVNMLAAYRVQIERRAAEEKAWQDRLDWDGQAMAADEAYRALTEEAALKSTSAHVGEAKEVVLKIAQAAHAIGWQAGVGGMETAGAIVSYLAKYQDQIEPFMAGSVSPVDWPDFVNGGCLTWHAKDGSVVHPSSVAAPPLQSPATGESE